MLSYQGANYQQDFINSLLKIHNLFFYGPGFDNYNQSYDLNDVLSIFDNKPEIIFVGHSWLGDTANSRVNLNTKINLNSSKLLKIFFLNKEYVNLNEKLFFCKENNFNISFTHHYDLDYYNKITNSHYYFIPFAFDKDRFEKNKKKKDIDIGFSGILQNSNKNSGHSDIRRRITKKLFYTFFDIPVIKKKKDLNIFWNVVPSNRIIRKISERLQYYKYYTIDEYTSKLLRSKIYINTLSPFNLVSPRYFETLASGSILLCQNSRIYEKIFNYDFEYFTFEDNLSDFDYKLRQILKNYSQYKDIIEKNKKNVCENHTWDNRIKTITSIIQKY